jgi:signal transduction histidine kinase
MEIHIKDTGCGISRENLGKLFMNFSRLDEHSKFNHRGTGLGLSICKSLIEMMGGSVTVDSEVGMGTTFVIHFKTKCRVR